jgi:hypothetical protein
VTASDVALAIVTVKTAAGDVIEPDVAVMFVVPPDTPSANPEVGEVVLMLATAGFDEVQLTLPVMT